MAIENLTRVVFDRLCHEHGIDPSAPDAKHRLARTLGFEPNDEHQADPNEHIV